MSDSVATDIDTTNTTSMSRLDVIHLIGDVLTALDVLRSKFDRNSAERTALDNHRDDVDTIQRKLVRTVITEHTNEFREKTAALKTVSGDLRQTIKEVDQVAETLKTLLRFLAAAQKIAELAP